MLTTDDINHQNSSRLPEDDTMPYPYNNIDF